MNINGKRILSILTYYTLFAIAIIMAALTILYTVSRGGVPGWASVLYTLWSCVVIGVLIFDLVCTSIKRMKFISGIIIYVLSIVAVVVTVILYLVRAGLATGLTATFLPVFIGVTGLVLATTIYMIATFIVGEAVVEHATAMRSIAKKSSQQ